MTGLPAGYSVNSIADTLIPAAVATTISFSVQVPHQLGSGTAPVGSIVISTLAGAEITRIPLTQNTKSMLELSSVVVDYTDEDEESQRDEFDERDDALELGQKALIGTEVTIRFEIANLFDERYDNDGVLEDLELSLDVDDRDLFKEEIDDEYSFPDLDPEGEDTLTVTFIVSEEAEEKEYEFDLHIRADDGTGARHQVERTLTLTVERKQEDVQITKAVINSAAVTTCDSAFILDTAIRNFGRSRQRNLVLSITAPLLDIEVRETGLELDRFDEQDDLFTKKFTFPLRGVAARAYPLTLQIANSDGLLDSKSIQLNITACPTTSSTRQAGEELGEEEEESSPELQLSGRQEETAAGPADAESNAEIITSSAIVETIENPFTREDVFVGLFIVAIIMTLGLILIFFIILLKD